MTPLLPNRWGLVLLVGLSLLGGFALAWHYPVGQPWAPIGFAVVVVGSVWWPFLPATLVPALLPVLALAPWTGWLMFEEFDLLLLACAAGAYACLAWQDQAPFASRTRLSRVSTIAWLLLAAFLVSTFISMQRGLDDAGGLHFGWFQGYHEPMNSLRNAKGLLLAVLLLPYWRASLRRDTAAVSQSLAMGLAIGLGLAGIAVVWERLAFTSLLNFTTDYRATGTFWEMHVGGAALDGFLVLAMPFAIREVLHMPTGLRRFVAAAAVALGVYACIATFSRITYLALPTGAVVLLLLEALRTRSVARKTDVMASNTSSRQSSSAVLLVITFAALIVWMFPTSGYRGAAAMLGAIALLLPTAEIARTMTRRVWYGGAAGGLALIAASAALAMLLPKGAYLAYAFSFLLASGAIWSFFRWELPGQVAGPIAVSGLISVIACVVLVAYHWGSSPALLPAVVGAAVCMVLLVGSATLAAPVWPVAFRWHSGMLSCLAVAVALAAVFGGGSSFMGERLATGSSDMRKRLDHWSLGVGMLDGAYDWWFGKGLGRFPANHFLIGDILRHPGDARLLLQDDAQFLRLSGGLNGVDEPFRLSQRIAQPMAPVALKARVNAAYDLKLQVEICEKHLLYIGKCIRGMTAVKADPGRWQQLEVPLRGDAVSAGFWFAPRLLTFSVAVQKCACYIDLDDLQLMDRNGRNLLDNGGFSAGLSHWYSSSDRHHLPWHIKNMFLHVLFEQGIVGLTLWCLLVGGALLRLTVGSVRAHPLAPALVAAIIGLLIVGGFDSLLDAPRVAWLFYTLVLVALCALPPESSGAAKRRAQLP